MIFHLQVASPRSFSRMFFPFITCILLLSACASPRITQGGILVTIKVGGQEQEINVTAGSTVQDALSETEIVLENLDRVVPPGYTVLSDGATITVVRVREEFEDQTIVVPYEHLQMRNESLPAGETHLLQSGVNGAKDITIRKVFEDGMEVSSTIVQETILSEAVPEIVMLGVQAPFAPIELPGRLVYLAGGNAWLMEGSTSNRRPLITSGDLDGRILVISPDADWLMFSRKSNKPAGDEINTLWVLQISDSEAEPIPLKISNVIHFADWVPGKTTTIIWSTADPQASAPGWSANNDLYQARFVPSGGTTKPIEILETNYGGQYGWWGTSFFWSPDGSRLAYGRPDSVGFVDLSAGTLDPILDITLLDTHADWAWIPGLAWGADSLSLFVVTHSSGDGLVGDEESTKFDLAAISLDGNLKIPLSTQTGMFALPAVSRLHQDGNENGYEVAFMQAIFPEQSSTSNYRLVVMDRDGSNRRELFPTQGQPGLEVQTPRWSPSPGSGGNDLLAVMYQGNLWLIDSATGDSQQVTSDGLIEKMDWK